MTDGRVVSAGIAASDTRKARPWVGLHAAEYMAVPRQVPNRPCSGRGPARRAVPSPIHLIAEKAPYAYTWRHTFHMRKSSSQAYPQLEAYGRTSDACAQLSSEYPSRALNSNGHASGLRTALYLPADVVYVCALVLDLPASTRAIEDPRSKARLPRPGRVEHSKPSCSISQSYSRCRHGAHATGEDDLEWRPTGRGLKGALCEPR